MCALLCSLLDANHERIALCDCLFNTPPPASLLGSFGFPSRARRRGLAILAEVMAIVVLTPEAARSDWARAERMVEMGRRSGREGFFGGEEKETR